MSEEPVTVWIQKWLRRESLGNPPVGIVASNAFGFINQMYQLYKDVDLEKASPLEVQIFAGLCDFFEALEEARQEIAGSKPKLYVPS